MNRFDYLRVLFVAATASWVLAPPDAAASPAERATWYNAQDTIRRAQVGTYVPRLAAPVRVFSARETAAPTAPRYERLECRPDPSRPLDRVVICETRKEG